MIACRQAGAGTIIVTGLASDARKLALAREFGADHTIDVENQDAKTRIRELTDGRGADVVVDVSPPTPPSPWPPRWTTSPWAAQSCSPA